VLDEVQSGLDGLGNGSAINIGPVEPDIRLLRQVPLGRVCPVGAVITREDHGLRFGFVERCVVHSNTFGQNDLAMAPRVASLRVIEEEKLVGTPPRWANMP